MCHGPFVGLETEEEAVPGQRTQQAVALRGRKRWGGGVATALTSEQV